METDFQRQVIETLARIAPHALVLRVQSGGRKNRTYSRWWHRLTAWKSQTSGASDLVICLRGWLIAIENKPHATIGDPQTLFRQAVVESGGKHLYARTIEDVVDFVSRINMNCNEDDLQFDLNQDKIKPEVSLCLSISASTSKVFEVTKKYDGHGHSIDLDFVNSETDKAIILLEKLRGLLVARASPPTGA